MYSTGNIQLLCTVDTDMVKEISLYTSFNLGKPSYLSKDRGPLLGQSIMSSSGPLWAHQRKIIAPEFYIDRVKVYVIWSSYNNSNLTDNHIPLKCIKLKLQPFKSKLLSCRAWWA